MAQQKASKKNKNKQLEVNHDEIEIDGLNEQEVQFDENEG
jgi:hypothetical protein